ncbi:MAG TPA: hypothetical protein VM283_05955, partial [Armatimonadota bacterium]|nr:hypothetical protein [Armatimonadota bacterium]
MARVREAIVVLVCLALAARGAPAAQEMALDPVVERAEAWVNDGPDRVTIAVDDAQTHGTPAALHMVWRKDLGDIAGTGLPKAPQVPRVWLELPADLDLAGYTRMIFWARIEGARHGHLHVGFSAEQKMWG